MCASPAVLVLRLGMMLMFQQALSPHLAAASATNDSPWYDGRTSGQLRSVYQYRSAEGEKDSDLYQYLYFSDRDLLKRHLDFYVSGKIHRDLDGSSTSLADDIYSSLEDTSRTTDDFVYQLYLEAHDRAREFSLRAGRQYIEVADYLHIDGAQLTVRERAKLGGRIFYGLPVSYYSPVSGDRAFGASLIARPWSQNDTRLTYVRYQDNDRDADDERLALTSRQRWNDDWRSSVLASQMNGSFESAGLDVFYSPVGSDFDCSLTARRWEGTSGDTVAYSPLLQVLGTRAPYTYLSARLSKGILPWLYVSPGISARLMSGDAEDAHNRNYMHYDMTIVVEPGRAWNASLAGEYWSVDHGDSFFGVSGEIMYRRPKAWEIAAGAGFFRYTYDQFYDFSGTIDAGDVRFDSDGTLIENSPDSFSYFIRGRYHISRSVSVQVRGEVEDNSEMKELNFMGQAVLLIRI